MVSGPYRIAPRRCEPRPKRPTILRLRAAGDRSHSPYPFTRRRVVRHLGAYALSGILYAPAMLAVPDAWAAWIRWPIYFAAAVFSWAIVDTLLGYLRLRRMRRAMRDGDIGRLLGGTAAEHALRGATVTATTFPAIAAYRELARTGNVEAFAAKDLRPVTVEYTLQAMDDGAEAALNAARRAQAAAEEVSEMLKDRASKVIVSRRVITPPGAAIEVTELELSDEARAGLQVCRETLGDVK